MLGGAAFLCLFVSLRRLSRLNKYSIWTILRQLRWPLFCYLNRTADGAQFSLDVCFRGMLRGFLSRRLGIAEKDAACEGESIVRSGFGTACPFYPLRFSQSFFDFLKLMVFTTLRNEMWLTAILNLNSCGFNPLTISPQTQVFPVGFCLSICVCSHSWNLMSLTSCRYQLEGEFGQGLIQNSLAAGQLTVSPAWQGDAQLLLPLSFIHLTSLYKH